MKTWSTPVHTFKENDLDYVPCTLCGGSVFLPALNCKGFSFVRCKICGLVQMNPQPSKDKIIARYNIEYGNDYLEYELKNEDIFLNLQKLALKDAGFSFSSLPEKDASAFIDIGCATGALLDFLRKQGWQVTGIDISPGAEYAVNKRNLDVRNIPLEDNKFASESFDVAHASHLIEHLKDPRAFLLEVHRILKPKGCVYISTPNIAGFQAHLFGNRWRSAIFDHLYLFSARTLKKLLKSTGFKIELVRTWGGLAAGTSPRYIKKAADHLAKIFNFGDVMIIKGTKLPEVNSPDR